MTNMITEKSVAAAITLALLLSVAVYYHAILPVGLLQHIDEYSTLDRVAGLLRTGDWLTVYSLNQPTFNKPPLQYWASAAISWNSADIEYAHRLPSFIFALGTLIITGVLAFQFCPRPIVFPVAAFILASSFRYWQSGLSALLDMGQAFFAVAALSSFFMARTRPLWWYGVAFAIGIGAIQKVPLGLPAVLIAAVLSAGWDAWHKVPFRQTYFNRHFLISIGLMVALVSAWPILQIQRHGWVYFDVAYGDQIWNRYVLGTGLRHRIELGLFRGQPLLEVPLYVATLLLPLVIKRAEALVPPLTLLLFVILGLIAGRAGSVRYSILIYPIMVASLSAIIAHYLDWKALPVAVAYSLIMGTPWKSVEKLALEKPRASNAVVLSRVGAAIRDNETLVWCTWDHKDLMPVFPGEISYYASRGRPIVVLQKPEHLPTAAAPYRGVCTKSEFSDLAPFLDDPVLVEDTGDYVHWAASKGRAAQ